MTSRSTQTERDGGSGGSTRRRRASSLMSAAKAVGNAAKKPVSWIQRYEVPRKTLHSSIGFVVVGAYCLSNWRGRDYGMTLIPFATIVGFADVLRFSNRSFARLYERKLGVLMREGERRSWNGVLFYLFGVIGVLLVLPEDLACLSVLLLSWCDTAASTVGRAYGYLGPQLRKNKSLIGTLAACITGSITTWIFYSFVTPTRSGAQLCWKGNVLPMFGLTLLGGLIAGFAEFVDVFGLDDNLVIPVVAGGLLYTALVSFGLGQ
ncbi:Diacylglycerol kinase [Savitreella phatthalungensis]